MNETEQHQPWPDPTPEAVRLRLEEGRRKRLEAVCMAVLGHHKPRNRGERRRVLHVLRAQARR